MKIFIYTIIIIISGITGILCEHNGIEDLSIFWFIGVITGIICGIIVKHN